MKALLRLPAFAALMLAGLVAAHAQTITQGLSDNDGDENNNGQSFLPSDSGIVSGSAGLLTFTFYKSNHASADLAGARFLHIATGLSGGIESGFIGSSTNSVDWNSTTDAAPITFTFSSLALNPNTTYFAIFSTSSSAGSVSGAGVLWNNGAGTYANGDLLHGGSIYNTADAKFIASFAAIPEPSTYALLLGVGALGLVILRRRGRSDSGSI